eukprot:m.210696 g.210696  ORF g.210696 m.210696 type:complete len:59 (+) comp39745_c0_seq158:1403-1579(+)
MNVKKFCGAMKRVVMLLKMVMTLASANSVHVTICFQKIKHNLQLDQFSRFTELAIALM